MRKKPTENDQNRPKTTEKRTGNPRTQSILKEAYIACDHSIAGAKSRPISEVKYLPELHSKSHIRNLKSQISDHIFTDTIFLIHINPVI